MMKHLICLALLLSVMPTAPALAQAQVQPPQPEYDSVLINEGSNLCLQPEYEALLNGLAIVQQPCNGNVYQRWFFLTVRLDFQQPGIYLVANCGGIPNCRDAQCLDDRDGKTDDWSPVQQWACNWTSTTMQWKLETVGYPESYPPPPQAQFINMRSGKCLDVRSGSLAPGAALQIYHCTSTGTSPNWAQVFEWTNTTVRPGF